MWIEGDRVVLFAGHYEPAFSNPCIGSEFECPGTVIEIIEEDDAVIVEWDNKSENTYHSTDLKRHKLLPRDNPNRAFVIHSLCETRETAEINSLEKYAARYFYKGDAEL